MAAMYHPIPALNATLPLTLPPQLPFTPSMSHPTSLQPSVLQGRESISLHLCDRLRQITGTKQTVVPGEKHHSPRAGAASISHSGNCFQLCQRGPRAGAAGMETWGPCYQLMMEHHRPPVPQPDFSQSARKRQVVRQHLAIPQQVSRHPKRSEGKMLAYLCKYKV